MKKEKKGIFMNRWEVKFLPQEPLLGIKFWNCGVMENDNIERPMFRIEVGTFFITFSYTKIDYSDLE